MDLEDTELKPIHGFLLMLLVTTFFIGGLFHIVETDSKLPYEVAANSYVDYSIYEEDDEIKFKVVDSHEYAEKFVVKTPDGRNVELDSKENSTVTDQKLSGWYTIYSYDKRTGRSALVRSIEIK